MRKDLSLIRRLEKIEKELGYCQIKLEKEQRLATRVHFLRSHRDRLMSVLDLFPEQDFGAGDRLCGMTFGEISLRIINEDKKLDLEPLRASFLAIGMRPEIITELEDLDGEIKDVSERLATFRVFHDKVDGLQMERRHALSSFDLSGDEPVLAISDEFEETEHSWNVLTEDLTNLDDALFNVSRSKDYLTSARNFVLHARSHYSVQEWIDKGYLVDLLKHSTIGRIREMLEGAERNLKMALSELICLEDYPIVADDFKPILRPFYRLLFDDVFHQTKFQDLLQLVEERLDRSVRLHDQVEKARAAVFQTQVQKEEARESLFHRIGDERRKLRLTS
ncbi:MAG: hypothetical protein DSY81_09610 [Bacillota bacterium]|nr:MAG: hypothetical protein DSY92_04195 [Planctomycetota bacterium]RUA08349.1 MAG: hypothetical protein DSY81_09610 [Bacillota bacterium]